MTGMVRRAIATVVGPVHDLNLHTFKEAAVREAIAVAQRDGLETAWVVEVIVYDEEERARYLATISAGSLVAWKPMPPADPEGEPDTDGALVVGVSHQELEDSSADGYFVVLEERDSPLGLVKIAAREEHGDVAIVEWRDPERDGHWVWVRTVELRGSWLETISGLIERRRAQPWYDPPPNFRLGPGPRRKRN